MATVQKTQIQESEEDSLARLQRALRDNQTKMDLWSLPLETLGVSPPSHTLPDHLGSQIPDFIRY